MRNTADLPSVRPFLRPAAVAAAAICLTALSGCANRAWVNPAASPEQASVDASACRRLAYREHPVFIEAERDALAGPVATSCTSAGIDNARAPCAINQATRLDVRQRDRNERPRQQAFSACLRERGYVYAVIE